jgi:hypothetical protein
MTLSSSALDIHSKQIANAAQITMTENLLMSTAKEIRWVSLNRRIRNDTSGFEFEVETGDTFDFQIQNATEMLLTATVLDIDAKYLELESIASPGVTGFATTGRMFMNTANSDHLSIIRNGSIIDLEASGGGGQTPILQDVDYDGFDIQDLSNLEFRVTASAPASTVNAIYQSIAGELNYNVQGAGEHNFSVGGSVVTNITGGSFTLSSLNLHLSSTNGIRWAGNVNRQITNGTGGFVFDIETGDTFSWDINGVPNMVLTTTSLDLSVGTDKSLELKDNVRVRWNGTADQSILSNSTGMKFFIDTGDEWEWRIAGSLTMSMDAGELDVFNKNINQIKNLIHDLSTSGTDVDFTEDELQEISIAANTTFTGTNYAIGRSKTIKIITDGTLRTLAFPASWVFVGTKPTAQAASKTGILTLTSYTAAEAGVVAAYAVQA